MKFSTKKISFVLSTMLILGFFQFVPSATASCIESTDQEKYDLATTVVVAEYQSKVQNTATFKVLAVFKGDSTLKEITFWESNEFVKPADVLRLEPGLKYLLYLENGYESREISTCSGSRVYFGTLTAGEQEAIRGVTTPSSVGTPFTIFPVNCGVASPVLVFPDVLPFFIIGLGSFLSLWPWKNLWVQSPLRKTYRKYFFVLLVCYIIVFIFVYGARHGATVQFPFFGLLTGAQPVWACLGPPSNYSVAAFLGIMTLAGLVGVVASGIQNFRESRLTQKTGKTEPKQSVALHRVFFIHLLNNIFHFAVANWMILTY